MPFTVATAGHWATSHDKAKELAELLVENGLKRANISFDTSHAQFVPAQFIVHAARAFASLGIPVYIVGTFLDASQSLENLLPDLVDDPRIRFFTKRVAEVGRATKAQVDYSDLDPSELPTTCYRQIHHDIVVFWDGTVYPCCSTFNRATPGISVGNVYQSSLKDLWARVEGSLLFRTLKREGFGALYKLLTKYEPDLVRRLPPLDKYPGACSLCSAIFRDRQLTNDICSVFARHETAVILQARDWLVGAIGEEAVASFLNQIGVATEPVGGVNGQRTRASLSAQE
jgi:hypothetical protein